MRVHMDAYVAVTHFTTQIAIALFLRIGDGASCPDGG